MLSLLANDSDPDGGAFQMTLLTATLGGNAAFDGVGNVVFTPTADFTGAAFFTYEVADTIGLTGFAVVEIDYAGVNDAPWVAAPIGVQSSLEDSAWTFTVPAGVFVDVEGDALTLSATLADGSVLPSWLGFDAQTRSFAGTPPANFNGVISLALSASDGALSTTHRFDLAMSPVNDAPVTTAPIGDQQSPEDASWSFVVPAGTFSDIDGNALSSHGDARGRNGLAVVAVLRRRLAKLRGDAAGELQRFARCAGDRLGRRRHGAGWFQARRRAGG